MRGVTILLLLGTSAAIAGDSKLPTGNVANDSVDVTATILDVDHLQQTFATDFAGLFVVVEVTLTPKSGKPLEIHVDDFLMRSSQTGEHTGPLVASQIAGTNSLVITPTASGGSRTGGFGGFGGLTMGSGSGMKTVQGNKAEMKNSDKKDPLLDILKRKILVEKITVEPVIGLLFFPMEKEKIKHLELTYTAKQDKLKIRFK